MTQIQTQAERDAIDAHQGAEVWCPYDPWTQEKQFNEWTMAFNAKLVELEGMTLKSENRNQRELTAAL